MRREDLFDAIGMVDDQRLARCDEERLPSVVSHKEDLKMSNGYTFTVKPKRSRMPKVLLIAAIIAAMVLMMGCAWVVYLKIASHPDYPVVESSEISADAIKLSISDVTKTGMNVYVAIEGFDREHAVYMQVNGPFVLEKQSDSGWEKLPVLIDDPEWDSDTMWTEGEAEWCVDWSAVYGVLDSGTYRYTIDLLKDNEPVSVEFTIDTELDTPLSAQLQAILEAGSYYIRYTTRNEVGSLKNLSRDEKKMLEYENNVWVYEYLKSEEDMMHLIYCDDTLWVGMMYQDGVKYTLDHEGDDRTKPITGWNPWPDMDMNRLTEWIHILIADLEGWDAAYGEDGALISLSRKSTNGRFDNLDVEVTYYETWEFRTGNGIGAAEIIAEQNVDAVQVFSWEKDRESMKSLDVEYVNVTALPISTASEAIERAKAECTTQYDKIIAYRDEDAGMWKVEFQIMYGYQGYQYIYLNDDGITQMVSGMGSKVSVWKEQYPDP